MIFFLIYRPALKGRETVVVSWPQRHSLKGKINESHGPAIIPKRTTENAQIFPADIG